MKEEQLAELARIQGSIEALRKENQKGAWDRAQIVGSIVVPIVVAVGGWWVQATITGVEDQITDIGGQVDDARDRITDNFYDKSLQLSADRNRLDSDRAMLEHLEKLLDSDDSAAIEEALEFVFGNRGSRFVARVKGSNDAEPVASESDRTEFLNWVDDVGGAYVELGTKVVEVSLTQKPISGGSFRKVVSLEHDLEKLRIRETGVADADLMAVESLRLLRYLSLEDNPGVTDEGLKYLTTLGHLQELFLRGTGVTEAGLKTLHGLNLTRLTLDLDLHDTAGAKALVAATPLTRISR